MVKGNNFRTHASFGLKSESLDPQLITDLLGIRPVIAWRKGDVCHAASGPRVRDSGIWRVDTLNAVELSEIEPHVCFLLSLLEPRAKEIIAIQERANADSAIVLWWNGSCATDGYSLSAPLLARLAVLCNRLDFTFRHEDQPVATSP